MSDIDRQAEVMARSVVLATRLLASLKDDMQAEPVEGFLALTIALVGLARSMDIPVEELRDGVGEAYSLVEVRNVVVQ